MIPSPFHASGAYLNPNIEPFSWPASKDYDQESGWVHISHDFGTPSTPVANPHLVLYNRYSGVLRVFFLITQLYDNNNRAFITLRFGNGSKKTAILENYNGAKSINAVDKFTTGGLEGQIPNYFSSNVPYWTHADFSMMYDPCSCQTSLSKLYIELRLANQQSINLKLNGSIIQDLKPSVNSGNPSFVSTLKPFTDAIAQISGIQQAQKDGIEKTALKVQNGRIIQPPFATVLTALAGIAGKWAGLGDYLVGLIDPNKGATPTPMKFDANIEGTGSINWQGVYKTAIIANPGSNMSGTSPVHIPEYNHILGTFNLLKTPIIKTSLYINGSEYLGCETNTMVH
ncbi:MAG: hypothetical protein U5L45_10970 [Saprospiraceae bacterium]|nr:hypothetical protein [Saprospiraceae bacterium]